MIKHKTREDDYLARRDHLAKLSDEELKQKFWELADKAVSPLVDLAYKNTSPAIERSVLLRMGFSSLEAKDLVDKVINHNLISKGAGHVVYRLAKLENLEIREAGLKLINNHGWDIVKKSFEVKNHE
ncbi:MAG: ornithine aminomutase subunit alpha [Candidatus Izemoplasmatales bacterium]|jgi:D-ornithine 4,5-aminomutase subunit alpha|nr:ornithine aminomutase subunit alpha [Candidatus Izemoplasmatales bacterium]